MRQRGNGVERIKAAVREADQLAAREEESLRALQTAEADYERVREERVAADRRLSELIATGSCTDHLGESPAAPSPVSAAPSHPDIVNDPEAPKLWRIAFALLRNPKLDYAALGEVIWGAGVDAQTRKNRISSNLQQLRTQGVAVRVGPNTYEIDPEKLAERSGLPVPEAQP
jgi:hypothetical protein